MPRPYFRSKRRKSSVAVNIRKTTSLSCIAGLIIVEAILILYFFKNATVQILYEVVPFVFLGIHVIFIIILSYMFMIIYKNRLDLVRRVAITSVVLIILTIVIGIFLMVVFLYRVDKTLQTLHNVTASQDPLVQLLYKEFCEPLLRESMHEMKYNQRLVHRIKLKQNLDNIDTSNITISPSCERYIKIDARDVTVYLNTAYILEVVMLSGLILLIHFFYYVDNRRW